MPESHDFSDEVTAFLTSCIDSVEQVEILLLLRATSERSWTIDELSQHFRSSPYSIKLRLASLEANHLVSSDHVRVRYSAQPKDDVLVQRLANLYGERRPAVIERIFGRRSDPIQSFANAFRLRRDNEDG